MTMLHPPLRSAIAFACALPLYAFALDAPLKGHDPIEIPNSKGGFDYLQVDNQKRRLLLDHTGNGTLDIIDLNTEKVLKQIKTGAAQGVAVDSQRSRYYVSVSREKKLVIIDSQTVEKTGEVPLPGPGDALAFDPKNQLVYVGHDDAGDVWAIDPAALRIAATIPIAEGPEYIIYDPEADRLFQNIKSNDTLLILDPASNAVKATWPTGVAKHPHGMAFDPRTRRLFVAGTNGKLAVLSSVDGKALCLADMVTGVDQIALDPARQRLYCPSSSGKLTVLDTSGDSVKALGDVTTARGSKTVAVDPTTHAVWIAYAQAGKTFTRKFTLPN